MPFSDSSFDLVWSLESGEHMPDKSKFVGELTRVAKPGATIILCTWVHRDLEEGEELTKKEQVSVMPLLLTLGSFLTPTIQPMQIRSIVIKETPQKNQPRLLPAPMVLVRRLPEAPRSLSLRRDVHDEG